MMTYEDALRHLKCGSFMRRAGWNGKGMHIAVQYPDANDLITLPYIYIEGDGVGGASLGKNRGVWLASMGDMFAEDWEFA